MELPVPFLLLLWGLFDPKIAELREMPQSFSSKLQSEIQVSGRLGMSGGRSPRHAKNPLLGERSKTLSINHHALSPLPSHHHMYIIHLINWLQRFYRITMSLCSENTICAEKWRKAMIYYYYYVQMPNAHMKSSCADAQRPREIVMCRCPTPTWSCPDAQRPREMVTSRCPTPR